MKRGKILSLVVGVLLIGASLVVLKVHANKGAELQYSDSYRELILFVQKYPSHPNRPAAEQRLRDLIQSSVSYPELTTLLKYPWSATGTMPLLLEVRARIAELKWAGLATSYSLGSLADFIKEYPSDPNRSAAEQRLRDLIQSGLSHSRLISFIQGYPSDPNRPAAEQRLRGLIQASESYEELTTLLAYPKGGKTPAAVRAELSKATRDWEKLGLKMRYDSFDHYITVRAWTAIGADSLLQEIRSRIAELQSAERSRIAELKWAELAGSDSYEKIMGFIREHPSTPSRSAAEQRITELTKSWDWVRKNDVLTLYQEYLRLVPDSPYKSVAEKRIIDLEVQEIAAGEHGDLPPAQPRIIGGPTAIIKVENQTGYVLTVRYSGPDSKKLVIAKGMSETISLPLGSYKVAASVAASNVTNYYGTDTMRGAQYSYEFYIRPESGGIRLPRIEPRIELPRIERPRIELPRRIP